MSKSCKILRKTKPIKNVSISQTQYMTMLNVLLTITRIVGVKPAILTLVFARLPWQQQLFTLQIVMAST